MGSVLSSLTVGDHRFCMWFFTVRKGVVHIDEVFFVTNMKKLSISKWQFCFFGLLACVVTACAGLPAEWRFADLLPQGNTLHAAWAAGSNDLFVGGEGGVILHWDGDKWTDMATPTHKTIYGLHGLSSKDIWAVGGDGYTLNQSERCLIMHYDGSQWTNVTPPNYSGWTYPANAVVATSATDVWITHSGGPSLMHWNGSQWDFVLLPSSLEGYFTALAAVGSSHLFVAGTHGQILHYDAGKWTVEQKTENGSFSTDLLQSIWGADLSHVYAGGNNGQLYRRKGDGTWENTGLPTGSWSDDNNIHYIYGSSPTNLILMGNSSLRFYSGGSSAERLSFEGKMRGQWFAGTGAGDVVYGVGPNGVVDEVKITGSGTGILSALTAGTLYSYGTQILGSSPCGTNGVILHGSGMYSNNTYPIYYYNGSVIQPMTNRPPQFNEQSVVFAATATGLNDIYAAWGEDLFHSQKDGVFHWNGSAWESTATTTSPPYGVSGLWASSGGALFACGLWDIMKWTTQEGWASIMPYDQRPTNSVFKMIWGRSEQDIFVTTDTGDIYHYNGNQWTKDSVPSAATLSAIKGNSTDVYAVGANGVAWRRQGTTWSVIPNTFINDGEDFTGLAVKGDVVYAIQQTNGRYVDGGLGRIWKFTGGTATLQVQGLSGPLVSLVSSGNGTLFGFTAQFNVYTDQPVPSTLVMKRLDLSSTNWMSLGTTKLEVRPSTATNGSPLIAAWRLDQPFEAFGTVWTNKESSPWQWNLMCDSYHYYSNRLVIAPLGLRVTADPQALPSAWTPSSLSFYGFAGDQWLNVPAFFDANASQWTSTAPAPLTLWTLGVNTAPITAPTLNLTRMNQREINLSWPETASGFVLEYSASLPASNWTPITNNILTTNGQRSLSVEVTGLGQFYRLRRQ